MYKKEINKMEFQPRWFGEFIDIFFDEFKTQLIAIKGVDDYQGSWDMIYYDDTFGKENFYSITISYGSCSGCDPYEDLSRKQFIAELTNEIIEIKKPNDSSEEIEYENFKLPNYVIDYIKHTNFHKLGWSDKFSFTETSDIVFEKDNDE